MSEGLPVYSNKFSRKDYTQRHLFVLFLLKQKSKLSYDDFSIRNSVIEKLGLRRVPTVSTLKMFIKRISCQILELILGSCVNLVRKGNLKDKFSFYLFLKADFITP